MNRGGISGTYSSSNVQLATSIAGSAGSGTIPAGLICMWSGTLDAIPATWVLCDGNNGTPDLRDKFVRGASAGAGAGATGGSDTHTHSDHAALTHTAHNGGSVADHAPHTHTYNTVIAHTHTQTYHSTTTGTQSGPTTAPDTSSSVNASWVVQTASTGSAFGTTANGSITLSHVVTNPSAHSDHAAMTHTTVNSYPAYYAVVFIMKT